MAEGHCIMNLCMAATYDPDPAAPNGFRLPFNLETGEVLPERWRQWQRHDPVRLVERYKRNPTALRGIYIDCGRRDPVYIPYSAPHPSPGPPPGGIEPPPAGNDGAH